MLYSEKDRLEIESLLKGLLPRQITVDVTLNFNKYKTASDIRIFIYTYNYDTRPLCAVDGVRANCISLWLWNEWELQFHAFGLCGGQTIKRMIDSNIDKEKYLAFGRERIPFRTPKANRKSVFSALSKIPFKYISVLKEIKDRDLLLYERYIDYSFLE